MIATVLSLSTAALAEPDKHQISLGEVSLYFDSGEDNCRLEPAWAKLAAEKAGFQQASLTETKTVEVRNQASRRSAAQLNAALFAGFKVSLYAGAVVLPILGAWFLWARHQRAKALVANKKR